MGVFATLISIIAVETLVIGLALLRRRAQVSVGFRRKSSTDGVQKHPSKKRRMSADGKVDPFPPPT